MLFRAFARELDGRDGPVFTEAWRAEALVGYGNASERGSFHRRDQLGHFARQELRPVWRTREEIWGYLAERTILEEPGERPRR